MEFDPQLNFLCLTTTSTVTRSLYRSHPCKLHYWSKYPNRGRFKEARGIRTKNEIKRGGGYFVTFMIFPQRQEGVKVVVIKCQNYHFLTIFPPKCWKITIFLKNEQNSDFLGNSLTPSWRWGPKWDVYVPYLGYGLINHVVWVSNPPYHFFVAKYWGIFS